MSYQGKKVAGIWMDFKHAFIIRTPNSMADGDFVLIKKIDREVHTDENYKNERFELAKEKLELKKYFKALSIEIEQDDDLYIFGPGKAQEEFKNVLKESHKFKSKIIEIGSSAKMSTNLMIAKVKEHFEEK